MAEEPERNDRLRGATLDRHERDERDHGERDGHDGTGRGNPVHSANADAIEQRADAAREEHQPGVVDDRPPARAWLAAECACDQRHRDGAERQVDVEDPAPGDEVREEAAEQRADERSEPPHAGDIPLHLRATFEAEEVRDDRHPDRHQGSGAEALQHAERDELHHAAGQPGQRGADEEDHQTREERRPTSEEIGQAAPQRHRNGGRKQEAGEDPRVNLEAAQALDDDGHRGRDDRRLHRGEEDGKHHAQQRAAFQAIVHQRGVGSCGVGPHVQ